MQRYIQTFIIILSLYFSSFQITYSQIINEDEKWIKIAEGLNFPEGPAFDGDSSIYFSNSYGGWIARYTNGIVDTFAAKNNSDLSIDKTNGLAFGNDGYLYVCEFGKGNILRINNNGVIEVYANGFEGKNFNRPNDLVPDKKGNLFFTDPKSYGADKLDGRLFCIDAITRNVTLLADSLAFPNGINISPIDGKLYVSESAKNKIIRFTLNDKNNAIDKEDFVEIPGGDPDGIEFDLLGNLYAAHFGGKAIYVFSPEGKPLHKIETPGLKPTNLEFGGVDYQTLFLTEVETNSLYKIRVNNKGKNFNH